MRIDKYLCECHIGTRSEVKKILKERNVKVNGNIVTDASLHINEDNDLVEYKGQKLQYSKYVYYAINKPSGVITATKDNNQKTVLDLIPLELRKDLFPIGRLDKDTEGLLILTNDGALSHNMLSPGKHVSKTYICELEHEISDEEIAILKNGTDIGDDKLTLPCHVKRIKPLCIEIIIYEGRYHQIKRMLEAVNNKVVTLKRTAFGGLTLASLNLKPSQYTQITGEIMNNMAEAKSSLNNAFSNIKACLFDMDGTLVDSMWMWKQIDIDFFNENNKEFKDTLQKEIEGLSFYQTAVYIKEHYHFSQTPEEMMERWNQMAYEKYSNEVDFKPGALDFLIECKKRNIKLGIATSNSRYLFDAVKKHLELDKYFQCMITGTEVPNGKPAPDVYLKVASELDVKPEECLVFEDIIPGIIAGKRAGMKVCAVEDAYSLIDLNQKRKEADYYLKEYYDILPVIRSCYE